MDEDNKKKNGVSKGLYALYLLCLVGAVFLIGRMFHIVFFFQPDPEIRELVTPKSTKQVIESERGAILAQDGRLLAMTVPAYDIHMDCTVKQGEDEEWHSKARELCKGLASIIGGKSSEQYYQGMCAARKAGSKYYQVCKDIDLTTYNKIRQLPLFNESRFKGGMIEDHRMVRVYPYGKLAYRTLGFVRDNRSTVGNTHVGLEGKFDDILHGKEGYEYIRTVDNNQKVLDYSMGYKPAKNGQDIHTTLNIDYQDAADKALRNQIEDEPDIEGGCLVLMDVKTGAIRAMVNLLRDSTSNKLFEMQNLAIGRRGEPGSVFKTVTLVSVLSDGYIKSLNEKMPTNHGVVKNANYSWNDWDHLRAYGNEISILDGFKISSNYVFATLAIENYGSNPRKFIDNIYLYKLGEAFDFDLEGLRSPNIPTPGGSDWHKNMTLGYIGFGYNTEETPLHILTFYNAIANKGKEMKPYLVESIEEHGIVVDKRGPSVLQASICSKAVADTVTRALAAVTEEGTARVLKNARCHIAGKTGTSFAVFEKDANPKNGYIDIYGRRKYQGTFVGFFPTEDPQYSVICAIYSKPTSKSFQGGGIPARAVKELVDRVVSTDPYWRESIHKNGRLDIMMSQVGEIKKGEVPDVKGLGLKDAIYAIENAGFACNYSGTGHVKSQSIDNKTINIVLE